MTAPEQSEGEPEDRTHEKEVAEEYADRDRCPDHHE